MSQSEDSAVCIAEATEADIPALCELLAVLFAQESEFQPNSMRQEAGLRQIIGQSRVGRLVKMHRGSQIIGMVSLVFVPSTAVGGRAAILEDMIIHKDWRGMGHGSSLLQAAIQAAREAGCRRITLLTDADNAAAQQFYTRHGFVKSTMLPMRLRLD